jgi:hypothetical protein
VTTDARENLRSRMPHPRAQTTLPGTWIINASGEGGAGGPVGSAPGKDTQVIFNKGGGYFASPMFIFDYKNQDVKLNVQQGSGFIAPVFNSYADLAPSPSGAVGFQLSNGEMQIFGDGHITCNYIRSNTMFLSNADLQPNPGQVYSFLNSSANAAIYGDGHAGFQWVAANWFDLTTLPYNGQGGVYIPAPPAVPAGGTARVYYDTAKGGFFYNAADGKGWLPFGENQATGYPNNIQYAGASGQFASTPGFSYDPNKGILNVPVQGSAPGVIAPLFNATGEPGSNIAFQAAAAGDTSGTGVSITTSGDLSASHSVGTSYLTLTGLHQSQEPNQTAGNAVIYWNTDKQQLLIGTGNGFIPLGAPPKGPAGAVQLSDGAGAFTYGSGLVYDSAKGILTIPTAGTAPGIIAPLFNATGEPGTGLAFQCLNGPNDVSIDNAGNLSATNSVGAGCLNITGRATDPPQIANTAVIYYNNSTVPGQLKISYGGGGFFPIGNAASGGLYYVQLSDGAGNFKSATSFYYDWTVGQLNVPVVGTTGGIISPLFNANMGGEALAFQAGSVFTVDKSGNLTATGLIQFLRGAVGFSKYTTTSVFLSQTSGDAYYEAATGSAGYAGVIFSSRNSHTSHLIDDGTTAEWMAKGNSNLSLKCEGGGGIIQFATNGSERVRITNPGYVGITTSAPNAWLSFGNFLGGKIAVWDGGVNSQYGFGVQSNLLQIYTPQATTRTGIGYGTSAAFTEVLSIVGSTVGVLNTAPTYTFDVAGTIRASAQGGMISPVFTATGGASNVAFQTSPTNFIVDTLGNVSSIGTISGAAHGFKAPGTAPVTATPPLSGNGYATLYYDTGQNKLLVSYSGAAYVPFGGASASAAGTQGMVQWNNAGALGADAGLVYTGGLLGIGNTSPSAQVDVIGLVGGGLQFRAMNSTVSARYAAGVSATGAPLVAWWSDSAPTYAASIGMGMSTTGPTADIIFGTYVSSAWSERMRLTNGGKLLLGTTSAAPSTMTLYCTSPGYGLRLVNPSYGIDLYNDGGNFYMLLTNGNDPYGAFNGLRPFAINLASGFMWGTGGLSLGTSAAPPNMTSGSGASKGLFVTGGGINCGNGSYVYSAGDLGVARESSPTTGVVYFGNAGSTYLYYNGSDWYLNGGNSLQVAGQANGIVAKVFTATGVAGSNIAFQTSPTNFQVDISGNVTGQGIIGSSNYFTVQGANAMYRMVERNGTNHAWAVYATASVFRVNYDSVGDIFYVNANGQCQAPAFLATSWISSNGGYYVNNAGTQIINGAGTFIGAGVSCSGYGITGSSFATGSFGTVINSSGTFVGNGINCGNGGIGGGGFNVYGGYYGVAGPTSFATNDGRRCYVAGGIVYAIQ